MIAVIVIGLFVTIAEASRDAGWVLHGDASQAQNDIAALILVVLLVVILYGHFILRAVTEENR